MNWTAWDGFAILGIFVAAILAAIISALFFRWLRSNGWLVTLSDWRGDLVRNSIAGVISGVLLAGGYLLFSGDEDSEAINGTLSDATDFRTDLSAQPGGVPVRSDEGSTIIERAASELRKLEAASIGIEIGGTIYEDGVWTTDLRQIPVKGNHFGNASPPQVPAPDRPTYDSDTEAE